MTCPVEITADLVPLLPDDGWLCFEDTGKRTATFDCGLIVRGPTALVARMVRAHLAEGTCAPAQPGPLVIVNSRLLPAEA